VCRWLWALPEMIEVSVETPDALPRERAR